MADLKSVIVDESNEHGPKQLQSSTTALALPTAASGVVSASITDIKSVREGRRAANRDRPERAERIPRAERVERDRGERRINRRNQNDAGTESPETRSMLVDVESTNPDGQAEEMVAAVIEPVLTSTESQASHEDASIVAPEQTILVAPLVDTNQSNRTNDRTRNQLVAAEQAMLQSKDVTSAIAPLVRHINTVTERLNESQEQLGRLASERDALRAHLIQVTGLTTDQVASIATHGVPEGEARTQQRLARLDARTDQVAHVPTDEEKPSAIKNFADRTGLFIKEEFGADEIKQVARRRQLVALALFTFIGIALFAAQATGRSVGDMSKNGLADIAFIGVFFQMFLMMWMMYRVVRVGGKGAHWLFPDSSGKRRRR